MNKMTNAYLPPIFGGRITGTEKVSQPEAPKSTSIQATLRDKLAAEAAAPKASELAEAPKRTRGKQRRPTKEQVTLRLDPDIIAHFKGENSKGWQTRLNAALRQAMRSHG